MYNKIWNEQNILKFFSVFDFRPDLIQYDKLQKSNALYNLNNAFEVAEEKLGLTRLLDPEGQYSIVVTLSKRGQTISKNIVKTLPPPPQKKNKGRGGIKTCQISNVSKYPKTIKNISKSRDV